MLEKLKEQVLACARAAEASGLCRHKSGNFSARDPESGYICITPAGADRAGLTPEDLVVIDEEARVVEALTGLRPTSETLMHLAAYRVRADVRAIVHTHSKFATAFAVLNKRIPAIVYEVANLGCREGYVPVAAYGRPGTEALARSVAVPLASSDAVLLESHGALAVAADLKEALLKAQYVEELAEIYYRTLMINGGQEPPVVPLTELQQWKYPKEIRQ